MIMHIKLENNFGNIKVCRITLEGGQDNNSPLSSLMPSCSRVNHVWLGHLFFCPLNTFALSLCYLDIVSLFTSPLFPFIFLHVALVLANNSVYIGTTEPTPF